MICLNCYRWLLGLNDLFIAVDYVPRTSTQGLFWIFTRGKNLVCKVFTWFRGFACKIIIWKEHMLWWQVIQRRLLNYWLKFRQTSFITMRIDDFRRFYSCINVLSIVINLVCLKNLQILVQLSTSFILCLAIYGFLIN